LVQESTSTSRRRFAVLVLAALLTFGSLSMTETSMALDIRGSAGAACERISALADDLNASDKLNLFGRESRVSEELRSIFDGLDFRVGLGFLNPNGYELPFAGLLDRQSGANQSGWQEGYDQGRKSGRDHAATDETADRGREYSEGFLAGYLEGYHAEKGIFADLSASVDKAPDDPAFEILLTLKASRSDGAPLPEADVRITAACQQGQVIPSSQTGRTTSAGEFETIWRYTLHDGVSLSNVYVDFSASVSISGKQAEKSISVNVIQTASSSERAGMQQMQLYQVPTAVAPASSDIIEVDVSTASRKPEAGVGGLDSSVAGSASLDAKSVSSWYELGQDASARESYQEAIGYFEKAIVQDPASAIAWEGKGTALSSLGDYQGAIDSYQMAAELDPGWAMPWGLMGDALFAMERYEEAVSSYDKAIALEPDWAVVWEGKGFALEALGRYDESKVALSRAWELGGSQ